jgi:recombinational DNA repair protein RecT
MPSLVYDGEEFDYHKGSGHDDAQMIRHKPDIRLRSRLVHEIGGADGTSLRQIAEAMNDRCIAAYTHVKYANGLTSCWLVDRVELDEAEQQSPGKNQPGSLWRDPQLKKWMWLKTVIRQHCKYLGMGDGPGAKRAKEIDDHVDSTSVENAMDQMGRLGFDDPEGEPNA